jgi:hypothetical protein
VCTTTDSEGSADDWGGSGTSASNSNYLLQADANGHWNATDWVSSGLSASNDYHQFGLEQNGADYAFDTIAFVHTQYASCGVTVANGATQTVVAYAGGTGYQDTQNWYNTTTANPESNGDSEIDFHYQTTGVMNETGAPTVTNSYAFGPPYTSDENAYTPSDPIGAQPPSGANVTTVGGSGGSKGWDSGGSYQSTSGLDMSIALQGGWEGAGVVASIPLVYTTTQGTTTQNELTCTFSNAGAPAGEDTQFYYMLSGSQSGSRGMGLAVDVHVWLDDYCVPTSC